MRNYSDRDINEFPAPQIDWQITNSIFFRWRTIALNWLIEWSNLTDLTDKIDEFKSNLSWELWILRWKVNGVIRQLDATVAALQFWEINNIIISYTLTFRSPDSFWHTESDISRVLAFSASPFPDIVLIENLDTFPTMVFSFWTSLSWVDQVSVKVWGVWITINEAINDGDFIEVKWLEKEVLLNGIKVDYDWIFPLFKKSVNQVEYTVNWTFSVNVNIIYRNNLL